VGRVSKQRKVEAEIARLRDLGVAELRQRWLDLYGRPVPKYVRRDLMIRAIAYQIQVRAFGGLPEATKQKLREIAAAAREGTFGEIDLEPRIRPGTKLVRSWKNATHEVMVLDDGFAWKGRRYTSLSTIAKTITGTSWNGWRFFGIARPAEKNGFDSRGKFRRPEPGKDGKVIWPVTRKAAARRRASRKAAPHA
jgi:hypothetical protein